MEVCTSLEKGDEPSELPGSQVALQSRRLSGARVYNDQDDSDGEVDEHPVDTDGHGGSSGVFGGRGSSSVATDAVDFTSRPSVQHPGLETEPSAPVQLMAEWQTSQVRPETIGSLGQLDASTAEKVGRWGEQAVAMELAYAHALAGTGMEVTWVNEETEQGRPYDVVVASGSRVDSYVEVKTTLSQDKPLFEVTLAELDMARSAGSSYSICRVFGAGSDRVRIASLRNPAEHLGGSGGLRLFLAEAV